MKYNIPVSPPQLEMYLYIKQEYKNAKLNAPIRVRPSLYPNLPNDGMLFPDVLVTNKKKQRITCEYDGKEYHKNRMKEVTRDRELLSTGIKRVLHINRKNFDYFINNMIDCIEGTCDISKFLYIKQ